LQKEKFMKSRFWEFLLTYTIQKMRFWA